ATSSGVAKRLRSEVGLAVVKNSFSTAAGAACLALAKSSMNFSTPSERVGPRQYRIDGHLCSRGGFGQAAGERHLHGFRYAVMDHFHRNIYSGFAGDKNDPSPTGSFHPWQIMTRQTNAAHKIGFNDRQPFRVGDLFKVLDFINAQTIYENIHIGI